MQTILEWDQQLLLWFNPDTSPIWLDTLVAYWREKTTWIPLYVLLALYLIRRHKQKGLLIIICTGLVILLADQTASHLLKPWIARLRPCRLPGLSEQVRAVITCGSGYSFPSAHATNHFAMAFFWTSAIVPMQAWMKIFFWFWALSISLGQVYVGVHFPVDILAGAVLGLGIGWMVYKLVYIPASTRWLKKYL